MGLNDRGFLLIMSWMRNELRLKGNELLIYAVIYGFSQKENQWFEGSRQYLADWTGSTKQGVDKNLKSLIDKGLIEKRDNYINGVKFVDYRTTQLSRVANSVVQGGQLSCPHNIEDNKEHNIDINNGDSESIFESLWMNYPKKKGKAQVSKKTKKQIVEIGFDHMMRCIDRYKKDTANMDAQYIMYGSTFFNSGYVDYLDENYEEPKGKGVRPTNNRFNDFDQRSYDYEKLEKQLWNKKKSGVSADACHQKSYMDALSSLIDE